jgi:DNA-binding MarR family transcriptional regulator
MHTQVMSVQLLLSATFACVGYPSGAVPVKTREGTVPIETREDALSGRWRELLDRHARVTGALERALQTEHNLGVSEYEVLERLAFAKKDQNRMQELADCVHLSQSALSRLIGRLEAEGLVTRSICSDDRRGIFACLTDAGRARHAEAMPTQRRVLAEMLD